MCCNRTPLWAIWILVFYNLLERADQQGEYFMFVTRLPTMTSMNKLSKNTFYIPVIYL